MNIFGAFYFNAEDSHATFNVLKYNPFGAFDLINVTRSGCCWDYFPDKVPNYGQQTLKFALITDIPLLTIEFEFWRTVVHFFNASMSTVNMSHAESMIYGKLDPLMYLHEARYAGRVYPHPHRPSWTFMIVPHAQPYSDFVAFI